ncbi:MAG: hypothetical protein QOG13_152 [Sphingomonadales bacterium]|jgi:hypothetical protein|nr:hypothetical protein [Sphingomonadales bacterium]
MNGRQIMRAAMLGAYLLVVGLGAAVEAQADRAAAASASWENWIRQNPILSALVAAVVALIGHAIPLWRDMIARTFSAKVETAIECRFLALQREWRPIELRFMVANKGGRRSRLLSVSFWVKGIESGTALSRVVDVKPAATKGAEKGGWRGRLVPLTSWVARILRGKTLSRAVNVRPAHPRSAEKGGWGGDLQSLTSWVKRILGGRALPRRGNDKLHFPVECLSGEFVSPLDEWLFVDAGTTQAFTFPAMIPGSLSLILVRFEILPRGGHRYTDERVFQVPALEPAGKGVSLRSRKSPTLRLGPPNPI